MGATRESKIRYLEQGVSQRAIAERLGISRGTVYRWIKRGKIDRELAEAPATERGRPGPRGSIPTTSSFRPALQRSDTSTAPPRPLVAFDSLGLGHITHPFLDRGGLGTRGPEQGRGCLLAHGPVHESAPAHERLGGVSGGRGLRTLRPVLQAALREQLRGRLLARLGAPFVVRASPRMWTLRSGEGMLRSPSNPRLAAPALAIERERIREIARIGNNLNQLARWANTHKTEAEAVAVIANLVSFERSLLAVARFDGDGAAARGRGGSPGGSPSGGRRRRLAGVRAQVHVGRDCLGTGRHSDRRADRRGSGCL